MPPSFRPRDDLRLVPPKEGGGEGGREGKGRDGKMVQRARPAPLLCHLPLILIHLNHARREEGGRGGGGKKKGKETGKDSNLLLNGANQGPRTGHGHSFLHLCGKKEKGKRGKGRREKEGRGALPQRGPSSPPRTLMPFSTSFPKKKGKRKGGGEEGIKK